MSNPSQTRSRYSIRSLLCLLICSGFAPLSCAADASALPEPREPLTAQHSGLYCGWNDYFHDEHSPFDFFIVQGVVYEDRDHAFWADQLLQARGKGKRIIVDLIPQAKNKDGQWYGFTSLNASSKSEELDRLVDVVDHFFSQIDVTQVYAITLGEEQVFWDGHAELLNQFYEKIKARHDVPIYQWFSPSSQGSTPGISGWPNLKADGWISDEYFLSQPLMEKAMRGFRILQKPVIHVVWAGGEKNSVPFISDRFADQIEVCRKYDIPTGYFTWYGEGGAWGWSPQAPETLKEKFNLVLQAAEEAESLSAPDRTAWDSVPWEIPVIELGFGSHEDVQPGYREHYVEDRMLRFVNDAAITGFDHLRWDSSPVELRPKVAGDAHASITYSFVSPFPVNKLEVYIEFIKPNKDAAISVEVLNSDKAVVGKRKIKLGRDGTIRLTIPGNRISDGRFDIALGMAGTAEVSEEVLAGIRSIEVEADVDLPSEKVIELSLNDSGAFGYEQDMRSMKIYHTAELKNLVKFSPSASGMHANINPGVLEVIQKFHAPQDVELTMLSIEGSANETSKYKGRIGVGVSRDGQNVLNKVMSQGAFSDTLELDLSVLKNLASTDTFYVHFFMDGGFGVIKSYSLQGRAATSEGK